MSVTEFVDRGTANHGLDCSDRKEARREEMEGESRTDLMHMVRYCGEGVGIRKRKETVFFVRDIGVTSLRLKYT